MRSLAWSLRHLRTDSIRYLTVPVTGTGMVGAASVVFLDGAADRTLWKEVRRDNVESWVEDNPDQLTPQIVR